MMVKRRRYAPRMSKKVKEWMKNHTLEELEAVLPLTTGRERELLEEIVAYLREIEEDLYFWEFVSLAQKQPVELPVIA